MSSPSRVTEFPVQEEYSSKGTGITPEDVLKLRQWLRTQPHLPEEHITDLDLVLCYHCCERSTEVAKQVLDLNLTLKTMFSVFKRRLVDDHVLRTADVAMALPLEMRTREGDAVFYLRLIDYDVKKFVFHDCVKHAFLVLDLWQYSEGTWPGLELILDFEGVQLAHIAKLDLSSIQQFLYYLQQAALVKLKRIHFMNAPSFIDRFLMLIRPFMLKALLDSLQIHAVGSRTLDKWVPLEALPKDAGGQFKSLAQARDDTKARLRANADFFVAEAQKRVVEARRPGRPKTISDIFGGVEGSFKKLDID